MDGPIQPEPPEPEVAETLGQALQAIASYQDVVSVTDPLVLEILTLARQWDRRRHEVPLTAFKFSRRLAALLQRNGITTLPELKRLTFAELLRIPNFGRGSVLEIAEVTGLRPQGMG